MVAALIGILVTLSAPELKNVRTRAEKVVCMSHLRSLHVAFGAYLNDNQMWPQCPEEFEGAAEEQFWLDSVRDYGGTNAVWQCPTLVRRLSLNGKNDAPDAPKLHYTVTQFDDSPLSPRLWAAMPWLIEIGDQHLCGTLMIRTDGCILSVNQMLATGGVE